MDALIPFLLFCQVLGAVVGTATVIWGEFAYMRAMRDGHVDTAERAHLNSIARGLRFGMVLLLLASLGIVILAFIFRMVPQPALTASYWIFISLTLLIVYATWALSRRSLSFAAGSAIVFTAWWFLLYLLLGKLPISFGAAVALYVVLAFVFYAVLKFLRIVSVRKN